MTGISIRPGLPFRGSLGLTAGEERVLSECPSLGLEGTKPLGVTMSRLRGVGDPFPDRGLLGLSSSEDVTLSAGEVIRPRFSLRTPTAFSLLSTLVRPRRVRTGDPDPDPGSDFKFVESKEEEVFASNLDTENLPAAEESEVFFVALSLDESPLSLLYLATISSMERSDLEPGMLCVVEEEPAESVSLDLLLGTTGALSSEDTEDSRTTLTPLSLAEDGIEEDFVSVRALTATGAGADAAAVPAGLPLSSALPDLSNMALRLDTLAGCSGVLMLVLVVEDVREAPWEF